MLASPRGAELPGAVRESGWLGKSPATDDQIAQAERRLKIQLPPSYREFLRISNGWERTTQFIAEVWGTEKIDWFRKNHRDWIGAYTQPLQYGPRAEVPDQDYFGYGEHAADFRPAHLKETLQISEVGDDAVYLLNPQVIGHDGEWEAWFFANWLPGAHRYRSFAEMMQGEHSQFAGIEWKQPAGVIGELPDEYIGSPGSAKRRIKRRARPRQRKVLGKPANKWTVDELLGFLANPDFDIIHGDVIEGLEQLNDPRAVEPLLALVTRNHPESPSAAHALAHMAPDKLREPLLKLLREEGVRLYSFHTFASILAELNEQRAIPLLVEAIKDDRPENQHVAHLIGQHLAAFGKPGFDALVQLASNSRADVRQRAMLGLYYTNNPAARDVLQKMLGDPDPTIRQYAPTYLQLLPPKRK